MKNTKNMKKTINLLTIASALALLASCGGGTQNQNASRNGADTDGAGRDGVHTVSTTEPETTTDPTINFPEPTTNVAYEVALQLNPQAKKHQPADTADKLEYSFDFADDEHYDLGPVATTRCMPNIDGGYTVIYQEKEEGVLGDGYVEYVGKFDVYLYKDGKLTPKQDLLPKPTFANFEAQDALVMMGREKDIADFISKGNKFTYYLVEGKNLAVCTDFESDNSTVYYHWNGKQFVQSNDCESKRSVQLISGKGLGKILLGSDAPGDIKGFKQEKKGNNVIYSKFGKPYFTISLSQGNKIDTIQVHTWLYSFPMKGLWGDSYYRVGCTPVDDCFGDAQSNRDNDYFVFTNGVWVRKVEINGGMIDFITTKNAIKDVKGTEGKVIKPEPPSFEGSDISNWSEKVTLIKIYKTAGFCETCAKNSDNDNVLQIRKMYNAVANDKNLVKKHIEIEDEESGYPCDYDYYYKDGDLVMVQMTTGDGTMVDTKIYMQDGYPYFCFNVTTYPDNTKDEDRIYMCAGKIFKYLDTQKKDLNVNDDVVTRAQISINSIVQVALDNEKKAK